MSVTLKEIFSKEKSFNEDILSAAEHKNLVFFLGAGVSRLMGLPGWEEFSAQLIEKAFPDYSVHTPLLKEISNSKERITIAFKEFERLGRKEEFYVCFGEAMKPKREFKAKKNIYRILNRFSALFLTTNADNLFEEILGTAVCHESCYLDGQTKEFLGKTNHLFYLHGHYTEHIDINKNNLVFTADKYVERYNQIEFQEFLRSIFNDENKVIVFIGYGLSEFELIDYIVTKVGYGHNQKRRVFVMLGFCSNEDIIYQAKKSYFDSLNIDVIPYDMDKDGYASLIDVLEGYSKAYGKQVIPPERKDIENAIKLCNEENVAQILHYLKDGELAKTYEKKIADEILKNDIVAWMLALHKEKIFTAEILEQRIPNRAWPLLGVLVKWIKEEGEEAQDVAEDFLSCVTLKHIAQLDKERNIIFDDIVSIIISLNKKHIKQEYISLLKDGNLRPNMFLLIVLRNDDIGHIAIWEKEILVSFMDVIFGSIVFEKRRDMDAYALKEIVKKLLKKIPENSQANTIMFEYFTEMLIRNAEVEGYNAFLHVNNLDNLEKTYDEYYKYCFNAINSFFCRLSEEEQKSIVKSLLERKEISAKKLGLYLARKYSLILIFDLSSLDLYSTYEYYCEYYIYLKFLSETNNITDLYGDSLCERIVRAEWGMYRNGAKKDEEWDRYIESKRLTILQLLPGEKSLKAALKIQEKGIVPYAPLEVADRCDYVRSIEWEPEHKITKEHLSNKPCENWVDEVIPFLGLEDSWEVHTICEQFINILLEENQEVVISVLATFTQIPIEKLDYMISVIYSKYDSLVMIRDQILSLALWILENTDKDIKYANLIKTTCKILNKIVDEKDDLETAQKILYGLSKWLDFSINTERVFDSDEHILENLINYGDFDKFTLWICCQLCVKNYTKQRLSQEDTKLILDLLGQYEGTTFKYTLCYYYNNIKYLVEEDSEKVFEVITNTQDGFDLIALQLCIANSRYILDEFVEKIIEEYLDKQQVLPKAANNNILARQFYSMIISAKFYDRIPEEKFLKGFTDKGFLEFYFHNLTFLSSKENFDLEQQVNIGWNYLKENSMHEECVKYAEYVLHTLEDVTTPTVGLLDIYLEAADKCQSFSAYSIKIEHIVGFFDVDTEKAHELTKFVVTKRLFWDEENLRKLFEKYKEKALNRKGKEIVILLQEQGIISFDQKAEWGEFFNNH